MELDPAVDVPVILNTMLTGPDRVNITTVNISQPIAILGTATIHTSRVVISTFEREKSGNYACIAILSSSSNDPYFINGSATSNLIQVTTGEIIMGNRILISIYFL